MPRVGMNLTGLRAAAGLIALLLMAALVGCGTAGEDPARLEERVKSLMAEGRLDEAETEITVLLEKAPQRAGAHVLAARIHQARGRHVRAVESFQRAVELEPGLRREVRFALLAARYHATLERREAAAGLEGGAPGSSGEGLGGLVRVIRPARALPDLLFISIDTLRADHLGSYGHHLAISPVLDRFSRSGTLFSRVETAIPHTNPSHCTMMTSLYPHTHGVLVNGFSLNYAEDTRLDAGQATLAAVLGEAGFQSAAFVSNWVLHSAVSGLQRGFDLYDDTLPGQFCGVPRAQRRAGDTTDAALHWLKNRDRSRPSFLFVHYNDPHFRYDPPPPFDTRFWTGPVPEKKTALQDIDFQKAQYAGEVALVDSHVGRLIRRVQGDREGRELLILITSDHGESLTEHDYFFTHGDYLYQPSLHVPLILVHPGAIPSGRVVHQLAGTVDYMPTLLHYLGVELDLPLEGSSLHPLIEGQTVMEDGLAYAEIYAPNAREDRAALRFGGWKLILSLGSGREELFDLETDPGEMSNLAGQGTEAEESLRRVLAGLLSRRAEEEDRQALDPRTKEVLESLGYLQGE